MVGESEEVLCIAKHNFKIMGEVTLPDDGPKMWFLLREPLHIIRLDSSAISQADCGCIRKDIWQ
jgi:hypothetical protein